MRKLAVLMIGLLGLTLLAGCGGDNDGGSGAARSEFATAAPMSPPGLREQGAPARGQSDAAVSRKEVITGSVDLTAGDPVGAAAQIADRVLEAGGRVDSRTEQPGVDDTDPRASLTVRVPSDKTDEFIDDLDGIGRVTQVSTNRDDVTMQWEDLDARIKALQTSVDRLRALIAAATNTADLIAAEQALSSRQGELDSLTAQKRHLDDQVALSTLSIDITTADKKSDDDGPSNFWDGIVSGWHSLVDWLKDAVVFTGKAIPWLGFLAVLGAVVWAIVRTLRRTGRSKAPEQSAVGDTETSGSTSTVTSAEVGTETGETGATDSGKGRDQTE